ncbi:MAG: DUF6689 family protein [Gemmatimonadota bacterium]
MRRRRFTAATAVLVTVLLTASVATAQMYVSDQFGHGIFQFSIGETVGVLVNPDAPLAGVEDVELSSDGRLLIARNGDVLLFDPQDQSVEVLDAAGVCSATYATYPDGLSSDIYVVRTVGCESGTPELQYLPDGVGPAQTAMIFEDSSLLRDVQVWPFGDRAGNILVLSVSPPFMAEVERTGPTTFTRLGNVFDAVQVNLRGFSITPTGDILVIDFNDGQFLVENGELVPYGEPVGPGLQDISVGADGAIYITDSYDNIAHRFDADGTLILPPIGEGQFTTPRAVVAPGFTPTPAGENISMNPAEHVVVFFEEIIEGGYTTAAPVASTDRVSPGGNILPDYVDPPAGSAGFDYIALATGAVHRSLIQVDVYKEGSRLFYATGVGDTFRDCTVVGSIDDARGTVPRFGEQMSGGSRVEAGPTEVVLVEDTRPLTTVIEYKFQRFLDTVSASALTGTELCPKGELKRIRRLARRAKQKYDRGRVEDAFALLADVNQLVRSNAGSCIPDTYPDNQAGEILAFSKTLMFSLGHLIPPTREGEGVASPTSLALTASSPVNDRSVIELMGPAGVKVVVRVYNASGRLVSTLFEGQLNGDSTHLDWDGTDSTGGRVSSGVYFVRLESEGESASSKVVLIR